MKTSTAVLRQNLEAALTEVTAAETALDGALQGLRAGVRAEKVTVSATMETAFTRVRAAREALAKLRDQLDDD